MGFHPNISYDKFPRQGSFHNVRVRVCFNYESDRIIYGTVVRDDMEEPSKLIIKLDDGRYVLATECMYSPLGEEKK